MSKIPGMPDTHAQIPRAAQLFMLAVSALVWAAMIVFGIYAATAEFSRAGGGDPRIALVLAGVGTAAGGAALLSATYQEWRQGIPLNRNPRAMFGLCCFALSMLARAVQFWTRG